MTKRVQVEGFSDGACKGNPGRGGWGCMVRWECLSLSTKPNPPVTLMWTDCGGKKFTTNQEMELRGALELLKLVPKESDSVLYLDSQYVLKGIIQGGIDGTLSFSRFGKEVRFSGWVAGWMSNGWKKGDGSDIKHLQLWKDIVKSCELLMSQGTTLRFVWVKGHSGVEGNEIVDKLANQGLSSIA